MTDEPSQFDGVRRRLRDATASGLLDEALSLAVRAPELYLLGLPGALLAAVSVAVFALLHRTAWLGLDPGDVLVTRTLPAAALVAVAWLLRSLSHGAVARRLARALGHEPTPRARPLRQLAGASVAAGLSLLGAPLLLPAAFALGRLAPLPGLIAADGLSLAEAAALCWRQPRARSTRATVAVLATGLLGLVLLVDLVLGGVLGVTALRVLTGADTTGLARLVSPLNPGWVLSLTLVAWVLVDPLLALVRGLLFLELRLGSSGADLERRWRDLIARSATPVAVAGVLLLGLPGVAPAQDTVPLWVWESDAEAAAETLTDLADGWDGAETVALLPLRPVLESELSRPVETPDGVLLVEGESLLEGLPDRLDDPESVEAARRVAATLRAAAADARALRTGDRPPAPDASAALTAELLSHPYRLNRGPESARQRREGWRERLSAWWESLWRGTGEERDPAPDGGGESRASALTVALVASVAALLVLGLLVLGWRSLRRAPALPPAADAPFTRRDGPDPRSRSARAWLSDADDAAARGAYGEAVRLAFLGVLAHQDRLGAIEARPGRSNGEYRSTYAGSDASRQRFVDVSHAFDRARYGALPTDAPTWQSVRRDSAPLLGAEEPS